jgi:predicted nucleic acid-binding Zn ribbon protein
MPTYVYKCTECGYITELERTIDRRGDKVFAPHKQSKKGCPGEFKQIINYAVAVPFETMRDKGILSRPGE